MTHRLILVTGATGYIASLLIPRLLEQGYGVRVMARQPEQLKGRAWYSSVEVIQGDVTQPDRTAAALNGIDTAYYLVHNMQSGSGYTRIELEGAHNFAEAAGGARAKHIIYLGGLADPNDKQLASHLRSRMETGEKLRLGKVPVTEFRAGVIAGPGSISFEMIRFISEAFPVMIGPTWLKNKAQPIAAENVIDYLMAALETPEPRHRVFEIGGEGVFAYGDLMLKYASLRGLKRRLIMFPGIPQGFMAMGVAMMTPVPRRIAYALIGGLANDSVVQNDEARRIFPTIKLINFEEATLNALRHLSPISVERVWEGSNRNVVRIKHEGFFIDYRRVEINASAELAYRVLTSLGGRYGWLYANPLWQARGWLDRLIGGPGLRGRGNSMEMEPNSPVDYYRVEEMKPNSVLRLRSELRTPGEGWMEWRIEEFGNRIYLHQTAFFAPRGLQGFLYWHILEPLHRLVFRGLIRAIKRRSESQ